MKLGKDKSQGSPGQPGSPLPVPTSEEGCPSPAFPPSRKGLWRTGLCPATTLLGRAVLRRRPNFSAVPPARSSLRLVTLLSLSLLLALFFHASPLRAAAPTPSAPPPPNIVFILCDDLGINDLHCYGRLDHHTPNLDRLASQGIRFTSAYCAQAICSPSRAAILTGKTPARLHLTTYLPGRPDTTSQKVLHPEIELQVPLSEKMLPQYFKDAGYVSGAFGKWHVGGTGFGPLEHGFDLYHPGHENTKPSATEGGKGEYDLTTAAEQFIETNQNRPFLVYLAHNSPHIPYTAREDRVQHNAGAFEPVYAGVIETIDDSVGHLLATLDRLNLTTNTIVIFTSDNGGLHVPEGTHARVTHNTPYRAGKGYVFEGGLRIPLIVRWPGHVPAGEVAGTPIINTDWIPTLLQLAGLPAPSGLDGISFASLLLGNGPPPQRPFFWHFPHYTNQGSRPSGAMRDGQWLMAEFYDDDHAELYNLSDDPSEQHDLAAQDPTRVSAMREALAQWRVQVNAQTNRPNPSYDPAKYQELYVTVDSSRFAPATASPEEWDVMWRWRKEMDAAFASPIRRTAKKAAPQSASSPTPPAQEFAENPVPPIPAFRDRDTILFQGDSITDGNRGRSLDPNHILGHGYAFIIAAKYGAAFPERNLNFLNRGVSGNTVPDLANRWQKDTLDLKPDLLSILIGINDNDRHLPIEQFEPDYDKLLADARVANPSIRFVLCGPFGLPVGGRKANYDAWMEQISQRRQIVERLARKYQAPFVDFQPVFEKACRRAPAEHWIWDGIHPTYSGHQLMADEWVRVVRAYWREP